MGAKHDRRCSSGRDDDSGSGSGRPIGSWSTSIGLEPVDGATTAAQCFLRAAGAYRHIGDTFANAPARAADLQATGVLYAMMMVSIKYVITLVSKVLGYHGYTLYLYSS